MLQNAPPEKHVPKSSGRPWGSKRRHQSPQEPRWRPRGASQAGARAGPLAAPQFATTLPQPRPHADLTTGISPPDGPFPELMSVPRGEGWPIAALTGGESPSALGITAGT